MNIKLKSRFFALVVALNTSALSLPLLSPSVAQAQPAARATGTAAEVNGEKITNAQIERQITRLRADTPDLQGNTPEVRAALANLRSSVVEGMINRRLIIQEAKKQKISAPAPQIEAAVAGFRKGFKTEAEMKEYLSKRGFSLADVRTEAAEDIAADALVRRWGAGLSVTEAEIATAYRENITQFAVPEGVRARHILVAFNKEKPTADEKAAARKKAEDLLKQARDKKTDFGVLAQANSDDPGSKARGGDLGPFPRGSMVKPFEDAAFGAKAGEIVGPIETSFGYHIIRVDEKFAPRTLPLEEVRDYLREPLLRRKREEAIKSKFDALRKSAKIKKS
jgi:parvulin-like peptidyl-prolyl isomerase